MSRIRAILLSMGLVIVVLLAQSVSQAQAPGGPPGGGGFGGRNRVSSPLTLASNIYVQEDLKLTDAQKEQVKALSDKYNAQRKSMSPQRGGGGNNPAGKGAADAQANSTTPNADAPGTKAQGGRTRGGAASTNGDTAKGNAANGGGNNGNGPNGGFGGGFNFGNGQGADWAAMRATMDKLQADAEAALAKILTKPQRDRIVQIQLRQEGPLAVTKPAMQKKLNMSDDQVEQIAMIVGERDAAQNQLRNAGREMFSAFQTPDGGFDRAAMNAKMQDPQFKAQMDQMRKASQQQRTQLEDDTITMLGKTLTKKQHLAFQKMQGPPFDLAKLDRNYDPAAAAAKEKEKAEAAKEEANAKKSSSSKKKTTSKTRRS
jgi:hypothetical protein